MRQIGQVVMCTCMTHICQYASPDEIDDACVVAGFARSSLAMPWTRREKVTKNAAHFGLSGNLQAADDQIPGSSRGNKTGPSSV